MVKEKISLIVSKYLELYNKGHKHYKDTAMTENIWQAISRELGIAGCLQRDRHSSPVSPCGKVVDTWRAQKASVPQLEATAPPCYTEGRCVYIKEESVRSAGLTTTEPFICKTEPVKALSSQDHHNDPESLGGRDFRSNSSRLV
ncbi:UNVERIFIED_CONTAM: hypothetical protein FKN15_055441 [Acipenser sinensis]